MKKRMAKMAAVLLCFNLMGVLISCQSPGETGALSVDYGASQATEADSGQQNGEENDGSQSMAAETEDDPSMTEEDVKAQEDDTGAEATVPENNTEQTTIEIADPAPACDAQAQPCARELLSYLRETGEQGKVIFGHENDTDATVRPGSNSDVEDLTGDISGIVGLDFIDMAYYKEGATQSERLERFIQISLNAAERGALITVSAHMPNFISPSIQQLDDGSYSFIHCPIEHARYTEINCALDCLPGGQYNQIFNSYLDMIATYGLRMQEAQIPVLFRPFHESNGSWFWWGTGTDIDTYINLFRYTKDYLTSKGVHNFLYVYSPNGPLSSEEEYTLRYPGDDYVDILALDYYNDGYDTWPATYSELFFIRLNENCRGIRNIALAHGKIAAISETGIWVMKEDYSGNNGLLVSGNPMKGMGWYKKLGDVAAANNMPYYLVWINTDINNFHVPFQYDDSTYHEMAEDFIDFYNQDYSLFAKDLHFYERLK